MESFISNTTHIITHDVYQEKKVKIELKYKHGPSKLVADTPPNNLDPDASSKTSKSQCSYVGHRPQQAHQKHLTRLLTP